MIISTTSLIIGSMISSLSTPSNNTPQPDLIKQNIECNQLFEQEKKRIYGDPNLGGSELRNYDIKYNTKLNSCLVKNISYVDGSYKITIYDLINAKFILYYWEMDTDTALSKSCGRSTSYKFLSYTSLNKEKTNEEGCDIEGAENRAAEILSSYGFTF